MIENSAEEPLPRRRDAAFQNVSDIPVRSGFKNVGRVMNNIFTDPEFTCPFAVAALTRNMFESAEACCIDCDLLKSRFEIYVGARDKTPMLEK